MNSWFGDKFKELISTATATPVDTTINAVKTMTSEQWGKHTIVDEDIKNTVKSQFPDKADRYRSDVAGFAGGYDAAKRFPELGNSLIALAAAHQGAQAASRMLFDWNTSNKNIISKEYNDFVANVEGIKQATTDKKNYNTTDRMVDYSVLKSGEEFANIQSYGKRPDGSQKGSGYFGELPRPDGKMSTELSIQFDDVLGGKPIPLIVPTLTKKELDLLLSTPEKDTSKLPRSIIDKAIEHAKKRDAQGLSPFARPEDRINLPKK